MKGRSGCISANMLDFDGISGGNKTILTDLIRFFAHFCFYE